MTEPLLVFENVITNISCSRVTGERLHLDVCLPITKENNDKCMVAYAKTEKIRVIIEVME